MAPARADYFGTIDVIRFMAASFVMAAHLGWQAWARPHSLPANLIGLTAHTSPPLDFAWFGWIGVQIFFVISGLVIANSAMTASPGAFLKNRVLRLYPAVWICAPISLAIALAVDDGVHNYLVRFLDSMILIRPTGGWISAVYWTLPVEIVFYALVLGVRAFLPRVSLIWLGLALVLWSGAYTAAQIAGVHGLSMMAERLSLLRFGAFFGLGIALWSLHIRKGVFVAVVVALLSLPSCFYEIAARVQDGLSLSPVPPLLVWSIAITVMALTAIAPLPGASPTVVRVTRVLGLMSYPIYLVHEHVGALLIRSLLPTHMPPLLAVLGGFGGVYVIAFLVTRYAEPALRCQLARLLGSGSPAPSAIRTS